MNHHRHLPGPRPMPTPPNGNNAIQQAMVRAAEAEQQKRMLQAMQEAQVNAQILSITPPADNQVIEVQLAADASRGQDLVDTIYCRSIAIHLSGSLVFTSAFIRTTAMVTGEPVPIPCRVRLPVISVPAHQRQAEFLVNREPWMSLPIERLEEFVAWWRESRPALTDVDRAILEFVEHDEQHQAEPADPSSSSPPSSGVAAETSSASPGPRPISTEA